MYKDNQGYMRVARHKDTITIAYHIIVAERALGKKLPKGAEVHHFDENKTNNRNDNLVICESRKYHRLLHVRQRIVSWGGDPNINKICTCCNTLKLKTEFYSDSSRYDGLHAKCISCHFFKK